MRQPTTTDKDVWVPNYSWGLPAEELDQQEVERREERP